MVLPLKGELMTAESFHVDAYLRPDQKDGLDRRSKKSGVPVAELIRNAVDLLLKLDKPKDRASKVLDKLFE